MYLNGGYNSGEDTVLQSVSWCFCGSVSLSPIARGQAGCDLVGGNLTAVARLLLRGCLACTVSRFGSKVPTILWAIFTTQPKFFAVPLADHTMTRWQWILSGVSLKVN